MIRRTILFTSAVLLAAAALAQTKTEKDQALIDRGKYIVENVAMCERCHTQRDERGVADRGNWLMGGPTQTRPTYPSPDWTEREPRIAGTPPGTDEQFITLLTTGISRTGRPANPPMPPFRMTRADAEAVLAYLKSLHR
jgi:mono/diheme cytochrome c family protein